jgi:hypothetical protein
MRASATLWLVAVGLASVAGAELAPWAHDPIYVYYPAGECDAEWIELEVWDRKRERWRRHPGHRRVPLGTCQVEDAGQLLNELRWRCIEPPDAQPPPVWVVGLDVFNPEVMQRCAVEDRVGGDDGIVFHLRSPSEDDTVTAPGFEVSVEGSVWLDGMEGDEYDVLLAIDRSESTQRDGRGLLTAQVAAAHALVDQLGPRLGKLRLGIYSFPNLPPLPGDGAQTGARPEQGFSADPAALHRALDRLAARRASGPQSFASGLDYGIRRLGTPLQGGGARPDARRVLVMLANAYEGRPFDPESERDPAQRARLAQRLARARDARIAVHLFAVGGLAEQLSPAMRALLEQAGARFHRVIVESVSLANTSVGGAPQAATARPDGQFRGSLPVQPGPNRAWARATLSDGSSREHVWSFSFDASQGRERWLAKERERMERVRQEKQLELRGQETPLASETPEASPPPRRDPE